MNLPNCAFVNPAFSSIVGEVVALVIGEDCVVAAKVFFALHAHHNKDPQTMDPFI